MPIYFGYVFDTDKLTKEQHKAIQGSLLYHGCYRAGAGPAPTGVVFGYQIDRSEFLFCPMRLSQLKTDPGPKVRKELAEMWARVPEDVQRKAESQEPEAIFFDTTDD